MAGPSIALVIEFLSDRLHHTALEGGDRERSPPPAGADYGVEPELGYRLPVGGFGRCAGFSDAND